MKTVSTDAPAGQRVEGDVVDVASQTGRPTPKVGEALGDRASTLSPPQEIEESVTAFIKEDDLSPSDAPEIMSEDDGEVRASIPISGMKSRY